MKILFEKNLFLISFWVIISQVSVYFFNLYAFSRVLSIVVRHFPNCFKIIDHRAMQMRAIWGAPWCRSLSFLPSWFFFIVSLSSIFPILRFTFKSADSREWRTKCLFIHDVRGSQGERGLTHICRRPSDLRRWRYIKADTPAALSFGRLSCARIWNSEWKISPKMCRATSNSGRISILLSNRSEIVVKSKSRRSFHQLWL